MTISDRTQRHDLENVMRRRRGRNIVRRPRNRVGRAMNRLDWFVLLVPPQKEYQACNALRLRGIDAFVPVETRWRRKNRYRKAKVEVEYPLLRRYVLVGFYPDERPWGRVLDLPLVNGVICRDGQPFGISYRAIEHLIGKDDEAKVRAPVEQRYMRTYREFAEGDEAMVTHGSLDGWKVRIEEIDGPSARILVDMLGKAQYLDVPLEILEAA